jgi:hypothetical protein
MKVAVPDTLLLLFVHVGIILVSELLFVLHPITMAITIAIDKIIFFITLRFSLFYKVTIN